MIKTKTTLLTYSCDGCGKQELDTQIQEQDDKIDSRYADYGRDFDLRVKYNLPKFWMFTKLKKIVCSEDCLGEIWDRYNKALKEKEIEAYRNLFKEFLTDLRK